MMMMKMMMMADVNAMLLVLLLLSSISLMLPVQARAAPHPLLFAPGTTRHHHCQPLVPRAAIATPSTRTSLPACLDADARKARVKTRMAGTIISAGRHRVTFLSCSSREMATSSVHSKKGGGKAPVDATGRLKAHAFVGISVGISLLLSLSLSEPCPASASSSNVVGKCSGSAMACVDPFVEPAAAVGSSTTSPSSPSSSSAGVAVVDAEHLYLDKLLKTVDEHYYDRLNPLGASDSSLRHTYNGIDWRELEEDIAKKKYRTRYETHRQAAKTLSQLGDKYTRFVGRTEFKSFSKYDVTGVGLLLIGRADGGVYIASPPLAGSAGAEAGLAAGDRIEAVGGMPVEGR